MRESLTDALRPHRFGEDDTLRVFGSARGRVLGPVIRCLVWNILKAKRRHWPDDFSWLVRDRELVLLQEAVMGAGARHDALFTESRRFQWTMARSFRRRRSEIATGIKTGCIAPASDVDFYLSPHGEPLTQTQKLLLVTRYPLRDDPEELLVLNMHAINFVTVRKYVEQLDQISEALKAHPGPVILAGDFNTWNPTRLGVFLDVSAEAGLEEATFERQSRLAHLNQHLDHVFYRGLELRAISALSHLTSSDHAPITVTFHRPPNAGTASPDHHESPGAHTSC